MPQAWAYACGVRKLMGKSPSMNMNNFPMDVWLLHRKLHHRFMRSKDCVAKATFTLRDYQDALTRDMTGALTDDVKSEKTVASSSRPSVVCLLSSSSTDEE